MPHDYPLTLLPTPTDEEVEGFRALCRDKYGTDPVPADAGRQLAGLMRFLYLTRTRPPERGEKHAPASFDANDQSGQKN